MAATARQRTEALVRNILSPPDPIHPQKKAKGPTLVNLATGQLATELPDTWVVIRQQGGWFVNVVPDPANDLQAPWAQYLEFEQKYYIHHPLVSEVVCIALWRALSCPKAHNGPYRN